LAFDSSQLITQARGLGAILFGFDTELDSANAAHRVDQLGDGTVLAVASMFELVDEIVLVQSVGLLFVNAAVKVLDVRPALSLRDGGIADRGIGRLAAVLQIVGESLEIIFAVDISLVGRQTIPSQRSGIVGLHALPELIHPAELVFRGAVALRRGFDKPGHGFGVILLNTRAISNI